MRTPAASAARAISGAFSDSWSQPSRIFSVTAASPAAPTTASTMRRASAGSRISAEPAVAPLVTFFAGHPMLMSMMRAPSPASRRATSAIAAGSRPAICTAVPVSAAASSARASAEGARASISRLATISETTSPAPKSATRPRNGRSVSPAIGASSTGGSSTRSGARCIFA